MKKLMRNYCPQHHVVALFCIMALSLLLGPASSFAASTETPGVSQESLRLGERIYREGILPSGERVQATLKGGVSAPGTTFACVSCHLRSGLGSLEDGTFTPPTSGPKLFKPIKAYSAPTTTLMSKPFKPHEIVEQEQKYHQAPPARPVYTDESLAIALRDGIDSAGRIMKDIMPRYPLQDGDMKLLIAYLRALSSEFSPGVSETTISFATILTDDVSPADRDAMLIPLENYIKNKNLTNFLDPQAGVRSRSTGYRSRAMTESTLVPKELGIRKLSLSRWVLKGPPETWRRQLEEHYRKEPVFALLGGMTGGEWQPIHQFCEENRIPSFFPITDFPVISHTDWYTLYLSKGYYQEGEGAARFLNSRDELKDKPIVQIVRDTREGRALSRGFQETWRDFGQEMPKTVILKAGEALTAKLLQQELAQEKPAVIILWDGTDSHKTLELLAAAKNRPAMVLVSSSFLGKSMFSLTDQVRDFTYLTYPYGITRTLQEKNPSAMGVKNFNVNANAVTTTRISQQTYILTTTLNMVLSEMKGNYYRDYLLDVIGTIMELDVPLYEPLSFGPGQRYASKGCYVVQFSKTGLIKKSGWESGWAAQ